MTTSGLAAPMALPALAPRHRHTAGLVATAAVALVGGVGFVGHLTADDPDSHALIAALAASQQTYDRLDRDEAARLVVDPASTRLLVLTPAGAHYAARSQSGELCLVRVPTSGSPAEVCVPDRVGADATIGTEGAGQVRLVAAGAQRPSAADGWRPAGPDVWVRD